MDISTGDLAKIQSIITNVTSEKPSGLDYNGKDITFVSFVGEELTEKACKALLAAGLQSSPGDGIPEYYKSGC